MILIPSSLWAKKLPKGDCDNPKPYTNLRHCDFSGRAMAGINLEGADLKKVTLAQTNLENANLEGAILHRAKLEGAILKNANLKRADLWLAILHKADLQKANLQEARLQKAKANKIKLQGANLFNANMKGIRMWEANLQGANLQQVNIEHASLKKTNAQNVDLRNATIYYTDLREVQFQGANFQGAYFDPIHTKGANFKGVTWVDGTIWDQVTSPTSLSKKYVWNPPKINKSPARGKIDNRPWKIKTAIVYQDRNNSNILVFNLLGFIPKPSIRCANQPKNFLSPEHRRIEFKVSKKPGIYLWGKNNKIADSRFIQFYYIPKDSSFFNIINISNAKVVIDQYSEDDREVNGAIVGHHNNAFNVNGTFTATRCDLNFK